MPETESTTVPTVEEVTEVPTQSIEETVPVPEPDLPVVDFTALLQEVSAQHAEAVASETALDSIAKYLVEDPKTVNLLTKEEIQELLKQTTSPESLTYEQAVYDLDVLFRAFRSAYGAYYYFGEEAFQTAQAKALDWLEGKTTVSTFEFGQTVSGYLSFLQDAHSSVGDREYEEELRCMDNVMIIGSNSGGYQLCGNIMHMWLPNAKAPVTFGVSLMLNLTEENVDFKGYEPDVWCNPADALDRVLNMLLRYELTDANTCQSLSSNPLLQRPVNMVLHWRDFEVMPDSIFGSIANTGTENIPVSADGEPISDYTVTTQSPELLEAGVAEDGSLCLTWLKPFGRNPVPVTITYNDMDYTYYCVDCTWAPN